MRVVRKKPMSINKINKILEELNPQYLLEKEGDEIVMIKKRGGVKDE